MDFLKTPSPGRRWEGAIPAPWSRYATCDLGVVLFCGWTLPRDTGDACSRPACPLSCPVSSVWGSAWRFSVEGAVLPFHAIFSDFGTSAGFAADSSIFGDRTSPTRGTRRSVRWRHLHYRLFIFRASSSNHMMPNSPPETVYSGRRRTQFGVLRWASGALFRS